MEKESKKTKNTKLAKLEAEIEELKAGWQRTQADFINYRKRVEEEKQKWSKLAELNIILEFLGVYDNLERAFSHLKESSKKTLLGSEELKNWFLGIEYTKKQFLEKLKSFGLKRINTCDENFNPATMEAVDTIEGKENKVIKEIESGWMWEEKVVKPAKVIVGKKGG